MGFYLAIPWLFYRNRKKVLAPFVSCTGIAYGILIGIARMMAGGILPVRWCGQAADLGRAPCRILPSG